MTQDIKQEEQEEIEVLKKKAQQGDYFAQFELAIGYYFGKEIEKDYNEAAKWLKAAAQERKRLIVLGEITLGMRLESTAQAALGICYYYGHGVKKNANKASEYFRKSSQQNDNLGCLWLAYLIYLENKPAEEEIRAIGVLPRFPSPYPSTSGRAKLTPEEIKKQDEIDRRIKRENEVNKKKKEINEYLYKVAYNLFSQDNSYYFNDIYIDIINFVFSDEIICFLENQKSSHANVILAFYYARKNNKEKSLMLLKKAEEEGDIIASSELGLHYEKSKEFDESIKHFEKVKQNFSYKSCYEDNIKKECYDLADRKIELIEYKYKLEEIIQQKESLQNRMQKMVQEFTHTLSNVIFPDIIYQVSERLKKTGGNRKDILLLQQAYYSEKLIKLLGEILRLRYANSDPEYFRQTIRGCRLESDNGNAKIIENILDYALSRVVARFLNQDDAGLKGIREQALAVKGSNLENLKHSFEDSVLLNNTLSSIEWTNLNLLPIKITEISPLWKNIFIQSENYTEALMFSYFSEILFNAFKYSNHGNDEFLTISFNECSIDNQIYLSCNFSNPAVKNNPLSLGTGVGLDAIKEDLYQLNDIDAVNDIDAAKKSLLVSKQDRQFQVTLFLQKDLLYIEPLSEQDYDMFL